MIRPYDLIHRKRDGKELSETEIRALVSGYVDGSIPDYQMSAMLMAIFFRGMTDAELAALTAEMTASGDTVDLSPIEGAKIDKHSTGGVGDKTTLIVGPLVAACGVKVAKMSGRGLGHTGGTVDKLEAIPGYRVDLAREDFFNVVKEAGVSVIGQSGNLAPADKKIYALRDVTATVESIPLIAASIMSKKLASGNDGIVLDVKVGSGAFMKTYDDAVALAEKMVAIGRHADKRMAALITDMNVPLGYYIGNSLEVIEAIRTLNNEGPEDLTRLSLALASRMLMLADDSLDREQALAEVTRALETGEALRRFIKMVECQGGDADYIRDPEKFPKAPVTAEVTAERDGYIGTMDVERVGEISAMLGAGRMSLNDPIDLRAGIVLRAKTGDAVKRGDVIAVLHTSDRSVIDQAKTEYAKAVPIVDAEPETKPLIYAVVNQDGQIERLSDKTDQ